VSLAIENDFWNVLGELGFDFEQLKRRYEWERDRRIRPEGNAQFVPTIEGKFAQFGKDPWVDPDFTRPPLSDHCDVIIVGGGYGGLLAGARLREAGCESIRIIEEAGDFGGTWYWNRYPGLMCDIEAHIYLPLLEELNYAPKNRYSYGPELFAQAQRIGRHYGLYEKACFQTAITAMCWQEQEKHWLIETSRGDRMTADYVVMACGRQSLPKLPSIPGIDQFDGHVFHSSRWDYAYSGGDPTGGLTGFSDKRVGVVGTGATALQIVPSVAPWAKELLVFQRTPSTVGVRANCETGPDWIDMTKPGWQKARRVNYQACSVGLIPKEQDMVQDGWTAAFDQLASIHEAEVSAALGRPLTNAERGTLAEVADFRVMNEIRARVENVVTDPATAEALKPYYRWFCKRPGFHDEYLPAFNRPNVRLVDTNGHGIDSFTRQGVVVGDQHYDVDCLIFATGFEAGISYTRLIGFEPVGRDETLLSQHWGQGVRSLHGLMTDKFPNCFFIGGNQHSASALNATHLLDEQSTHLAYVIAEMKRRKLSAIEPGPAAVEEYTQAVRTAPQNAALVEFYAACTPGYYNAEGKAKKSDELFLGGRYGPGAMAFYEMLANWRKNNDLEGMKVS
jgi:cation diffusion facilitator CzcD-associated flavoprotein CzcO